MGIDRREIGHFDFPLLALAAALVGIGLLSLYSGSYSATGRSAEYFGSQLFWLAVGTVAMMVAIVFDYRFTARIAYIIYGINIVLLALTHLIGFGEAEVGSNRWLDFGFFYLQPSDTMQLALVVALAKFFQEYGRPPPYSLAELKIPFVLIAIPFMLTAAEPDLGSALFFPLMGLSIVFVAGLDIRSLLGLAGITIVALPFAYFKLLTAYQQRRMLMFFNPEQPYQVRWSKVAIGSGRFWGKGFLGGTQTRGDYVPNAHNDFIFSVIGEEWGFVGCGFVLGLYFMFLFYGVGVATQAREKYGTLLAIGIVALFFWHIVINLGGVLGIMPVTGVTLPLISYGGTSLVTMMIGLGLLLNISMRRFVF